MVIALSFQRLRPTTASISTLIPGIASSFTPIVLAAVIYFVMLWPLVRLLSRLENRALARG
jgi:ABC-type amino acid transport system permease subunit